MSEREKVRRKEEKDEVKKRWGSEKWEKLKSKIHTQKKNWREKENTKRKRKKVCVKEWGNQGVGNGKGRHEKQVRRRLLTSLVLQRNPLISKSSRNAATHTDASVTEEGLGRGGGAELREGRALDTRRRHLPKHTRGCAFLSAHILTILQCSHQVKWLSERRRPRQEEEQGQGKEGRMVESSRDHLMDTLFLIHFHPLISKSSCDILT